MRLETDPMVRSKLNELTKRPFVQWAKRALVAFTCGGGIGALLGLLLAISTGLAVWDHVSLGAALGSFLVLAFYHFFGFLL